MKIFSAKQLAEADAKTIEVQQIDFDMLMERVGIQVSKWLDSNLKGSEVPIHIFCGIGNNGGDGLVVARLLIEKNYNVHTYIVNYSDKRSENFLKNYSRIKDVTKKWPILLKDAEELPSINKEDIIVDAMFGTGLNRPPKVWVKKIIEYINESNAYVLSVDMPSGLYADQAQKKSDVIIEANFILTFGAPKLSFFLPETALYAKYFNVLDIGLDADYLNSLQPLAQLISKRDAQNFYKPRQKAGHKGNYGHCVIIAGSYGKIGAAVLSATAAFRMGAGLVTASIPKCGYEVLQTTLPEAMVITDAEVQKLSSISLPFQPDAMAIGMGIGKDKVTVNALEKFLKSCEIPIVIDADALNIISENKSFLKLIPKNSVLTPHPGELERLIGEWSDDYDKIEKTKKFASDNDVIILIKGSYSITVFQNNLYINTSGNVGMATGGSGDVLSGMIAGLISQGYDPLVSTVFGVYQHGVAGDISSEENSVEATLAGDIVNNIGQAYVELFQQEEVPQKETEAKK